MDVATRVRACACVGSQWEAPGVPPQGVTQGPRRAMVTLTGAGGGTLPRGAFGPFSPILSILPAPSPMLTLFLDSDRPRHMGRVGGCPRNFFICNRM